MIFIKKNISSGNISDNDLLTNYLKDKNLESLGILYQQYMHLVYGVCLKYLKNRYPSLNEHSMIEVINFGIYE